MNFFTWLKSLFMSSPTVTTVIYTMPSGQPVYRDSVNGKITRVHWKGCIRDDGDGIGPSHGDPDYQPRTSLRHNGKYLNADRDKYGVVYPQIIDAIPGPVLGSQMKCTRLSTGVNSPCVAGDIGPRNGQGEGSTALEGALDEPASPISGGTGEIDFLWELFPGEPAVVNGETYQLQKA